jgi:hypothetical protein
VANTWSVSYTLRQDGKAVESDVLWDDSFDGLKLKLTDLYNNKVSGRKGMQLMNGLAQGPGGTTREITTA